ncbi:MAG: guanylate kinase [Candidatus Eisenbacteria bacterium]|nr:guanylate kinase [Candidatus Eisenbacteria bacterium]
MERVAYPIVVTGPSGAGKTSICKGIVGDCPDVAYSVSATTRPRREDEVTGRDYHFVDEDRFRELMGAGELLEWAEVHGRLYGTPRFSVVPFLESGKKVIMDIDVQGGASMRKVFPDGVFVFVIPPSMRILEERLRNRGTESEEVLRTRLRNAREETRSWRQYDYLIVNDELDVALDRLKSIIAAEDSRLRRLIPGS